MTQDRMLALIADGQAMRDAFVGLKTQIESALALERTLATDPGHLAFIEAIKLILTTNPRPAADAIAAEARHFQTWAKRNIKERERATQRRRYKGVDPKPAPKHPNKHKHKAPSPNGPKGAGPMEYSFDEGPEITPDSIFDTTPPDRDLLAQQLAADKALAQELLHDPEFRAITIPPSKPPEGHGS